jgi:hypothetical protein
MLPTEIQRKAVEVYGGGTVSVGSVNKWCRLWWRYSELRECE